jgi:hypothetical protein
MVVYNVSYHSPGDEAAFIQTFDTQELADKFVHGMTNWSDLQKEVRAIIGCESRKLANGEVLGNDAARTAIIHQALIIRRDNRDVEANTAWYEHILSLTRERFIPDAVFRFGYVYSLYAQYLGLARVDVPLLYFEGDCYEVTPVEVTTRLPDYLWEVTE